MDPTTLRHELAEDTVQPEVAGLMVRLARALHRAGAAAHRIEDDLTAIAVRLDVRAEVMVTPTSVLMALGPPERQAVRMIRVQPGEVDLGRLSAVDALSRRIADGALGVTDAVHALDALDRRAPTWSPLAQVAAFGLSSSSAAIFFGGHALDVVLATLTGLMIGLVGVYGSASRRALRMLEPAGAFVATFGVAAAGQLGFETSPWVVTVSGLIVLLPGFTLTVAMNELATRNLVAGVARLANAVMTFVLLAFGVALAMRITALVGWSMPEVPTAQAAPALLFVAVLVSSLSFALIFRVDASDLLAVAVVSLAGFYAGRFAAEGLGPRLGVFVGALVVGLCANVWGRRWDHPASVVAAPAILMLVPGSIGFRGISELVTTDVVSGMSTAVTTLMVAASLVAGLLTANVLIRPRGEL